MMKYRVVPVTAFQQNCSLLWCTQSLEAALVDPGGEAERLIELIRAEGVTLSKILLTHGHLDHVGAAKQLAKHYSVPIWGPHSADEFWLNGLPAQSSMFGMPQCESLIPDHWLSDGEEISIGSIRLKVLHCPGHTPGHVVFFSEQDRLAWVGDVLFYGSVGRSDFPQGNHENLLASIRNKLFSLGDDVSFIAGHGPMSTIGHERKTNPFVGEQLPDW